MDRYRADNYYIKEITRNGIPGYMFFQCFGKEEYGQFIPKDYFEDFCKEFKINLNTIRRHIRE